MAGLIGTAGAALGATGRVVGGTLGAIGRATGRVVGGVASMATQQVLYDFLGPAAARMAYGSGYGSSYGTGGGVGGLFYGGGSGGVASSQAAIGGIASSVAASNQVLIRIYDEIRRVQSVKLDSINSNLSRINNTLMEMGTVGAPGKSDEGLKLSPIVKMAGVGALSLIGLEIGKALKDMLGGFFGGGGDTQNNRTNANLQRKVDRDATLKEMARTGTLPSYGDIESEDPTLKEAGIERQRASAKSPGAVESGNVPANPLKKSSVTSDRYPPPQIAMLGGNEKVENGRLPSSLLKDVGGGQRLFGEAADQYTKMVEEARKDGVTWGITDSYRDYDSQVKVADEKGIYGKGGLGAVPGTSPHGWGKAVDLELNDKSREWLQKNASRFGFKTISGEPWHWQYTGDAGLQLMSNLDEKKTRGVSLGEKSQKDLESKLAMSETSVPKIITNNKTNPITPAPLPKSTKGDALSPYEVPRTLPPPHVLDFFGLQYA